MNNIYCFMSGGSLDEETRDELFVAAYEMTRTGERRHKIETETCEGCVTTTFEPVRLASSKGLLFVAFLEGADGPFITRYMLRYEDLRALEEVEYGAWVNMEDANQPIPEDAFRTNPIQRRKKAWQSN